MGTEKRVSPQRGSRDRPRGIVQLQEMDLLVFSHVLVSRTWRRPGKVHFLKLNGYLLAVRDPLLAYREATLPLGRLCSMSPVWERRRGSLTPKRFFAIGQEVSVQLQEMDLTGSLLPRSRVENVEKTCKVHFLKLNGYLLAVRDLFLAYREATLLSVGFAPCLPYGNGEEGLSPQRGSRDRPRGIRSASGNGPYWSSPTFSCRERGRRPGKVHFLKLNGYLLAVRDPLLLPTERLLSSR